LGRDGRPGRGQHPRRAGRTARPRSSRQPGRARREPGTSARLATGRLAADCTVVLNGRDGAALEAARAELAGAFGDRVRTAAFDVTDSAAVTAGVARVEEEAGPIDILVNNTGVQHRALQLEFGDDD
jgi:gluconate 5-dehydrogenase